MASLATSARASSLRSGARRGLGTAVKATAAAADLVRRPAPGVVVLIYHRVGRRTTSNVDLARDVFDAQVGELSAAGRIISIDEAADRIERGDAVEGPPPVVLTFDDGTVDWVEEALPVLAAHRAPATFYVATDFVERGEAFPGDGAPISWSGLAELAASGLATIGSHTHTHALLDRTDGPTAAAELDRSIDLLGERLGLACHHFAYPKALLGSDAARAEVARRFRTAAIAGSRANAAGADLQRLTRTPVQVTDGMGWFRRKAGGGMALEDRLRAVASRGRYAGATT
jgi:peptidoglycan/xylan/chitin deacetylase (PgdA/CDA1 family)